MGRLQSPPAVVTPGFFPVSPRGQQIPLQPGTAGPPRHPPALWAARSPSCSPVPPPLPCVTGRGYGSPYTQEGTQAPSERRAPQPLMDSRCSRSQACFCSDREGA